ncbi:hypothetical protein PUN28_010976 [Cardiocondyla obscurior]|uniref:Uncharacterized protein n=1 Tax=Cardiocondyla obscurior TaxID=286306 RepID=A0AAW2FM82_9HYME
MSREMEDRRLSLDHFQFRSTSFALFHPSLPVALFCYLETTWIRNVSRVLRAARIKELLANHTNDIIDHNCLGLYRSYVPHLKKIFFFVFFFSTRTPLSAGRYLQACEPRTIMYATRATRISV